MSKTVPRSKRENEKTIVTSYNTSHSRKSKSARSSNVVQILKFLKYSAHMETFFFQSLAFPHHVKDEKLRNMCCCSQLRNLSICELKMSRWRQLCQHSSSFREQICLQDVTQKSDMQWGKGRKYPSSKTSHFLT